MTMPHAQSRLDPDLRHRGRGAQLYRCRAPAWLVAIVGQRSHPPPGTEREPAAVRARHPLPVAHARWRGVARARAVDPRITGARRTAVQRTAAAGARSAGDIGRPGPRATAQSAGGVPGDASRCRTRDHDGDDQQALRGHRRRLARPDHRQAPRRWAAWGAAIPRATRMASATRHRGGRGPAAAAHPGQ